MNLTIEIPILDKLKKATSQSSVDSLLRTIAENMLDETSFRIHVEGKNTRESAIGTYATSYMKQRLKKGRTSSRSVVFSFTGQMERDWKIIPVQGGYGLGFSNPLNAEKAQALQFGQGTLNIKSHTVKAHTRSNGVKVKSYTVGAYTRQGLKGFGVVYQLTPKEKKNIQLIINDWLTRQT